jgi:hypothetical protein
MTGTRIAAAAVALGLALTVGACGSDAPRPQASAAQPVLVQPVAQPAAAAQSVADLVGARASSGESEMTRRGYTAARTRGLTTYWYSEAGSACVRTTTANGRYSVVQPVAASNCGR